MHEVEVELEKSIQCLSTHNPIMAKKKVLLIAIDL